MVSRARQYHISVQSDSESGNWMASLCVVKYILSLAINIKPTSNPVDSFHIFWKAKALASHFSHRPTRMRSGWVFGFSLQGLFRE